MHTQGLEPVAVSRAWRPQPAFLHQEPRENVLFPTSQSYSEVSEVVMKRVSQCCHHSVPRAST